MLLLSSFTQLPLFLLLLSIGIITICNGGPMMKSVEEKKVPPAAFWPYILHPTRFQNAKHKSEEREDYYDAVRDEDGGTSTMTSTSGRPASKKSNDSEEVEEETKQLQQMMTLLLANVDPVPMFTASSSSVPTLAQTVPSLKRKNSVPTKTTAATSMLKVDAETYDDERAEAGKDDEETEEQEEDEPSDKMMDRESKQHKIIVVLDGSDSGVREADAEADGIEQMPLKGTVDGQTHFLVDGETGGGGEAAKMTPVVHPAVDGEVAKRKGSAQFPKPPEAEIVRIRQ